MSDTMHRRRLLRAASVGTVGLVAAVGAGALTNEASASDTQSQSHRSPAGTWMADVTVSNGRQEQEMYVFGKDGNFIHIPSNGDLVGAGQWRADGGRRFTISFREWLTDNTNRVEGLLHVKIAGQMTGAFTFTGTGTVKGFDLAGHQIFQGTSTVRGTRFGIEDD